MKKLTPADYRSMPWKNGAGTTIEIAVEPPLAPLDAFVWRVSRAAVVADGAFSSFAGIDRSLALLRGAGMRLRVADHILQVDASCNIASFPGDQPTAAELVDGPIEDFNLMTRRAACSHTLQHWAEAGPRTVPTGTVMLYCARGSATIDRATAIGPDESVLFGADDDLSAMTVDVGAGSCVYCVQIHG